MVSAIIGARGFIGSALYTYAQNRLSEEYVAITRNNYNNWKGYSFNNVVWAAGSSSKRQCEDWDTANRLNAKAVIEALWDFPCNKFIYISSEAMYPARSVPTTEDMDIDSGKLSFYGKSKLFGEMWVKRMAKKWIIIRPNGFVGPGLIKNVVFDLIQAKPRLFVAWESQFQYIHTEVFADVLFKLAATYTNEVFNVTSSDAITPRELAEVLCVAWDSVEVLADENVYSLISTAKLKSVGIEVPASREAVALWRDSILS